MNRGGDATYWMSNNSKSQRWSIGYWTPKTPTQSSNIKTGRKFQIRSKLGGRKVLYFNENIGVGQYRFRSRTAKNDKREWFVYDKSTRSIRLAADKKYAISLRRGKMSRGDMVLTKYAGSHSSVYYDSKKQMLYNGKVRLCADIWFMRDLERQKVVYWDCHGKPNQRWSLSYYSKKAVKKTTPVVRAHSAKKIMNPKWKSGFTWFLRYLKATNTRLYTLASMQIGKNERLTYWRRYWLRTKKSTNYK